MARLYVVMKQRQSPIAFFRPSLYEIYEYKKAAHDRVKELNRRATRCRYWVESAPLKEIGSSYWQSPA